MPEATKMAVEANDEQAAANQEPTSERSAAKKTIRRDSVLLDAEASARTALEGISHPGMVGDHLGARMVAERFAVHRFACLDGGYPGWEWEVSLARAPRSKEATVCEVDLVPGADALLAPEWVPWEERLQPGDVSRDDVLPYSANDPRLMSGFEQTDPEVADVVGIEEIGMGRARVLSTDGIDQAAERWYASERGPVANARVKAACSSCGFLLKMSGSLGQVFGICANEWSPDDGTVVSLDHTCGAHSETDETVRGAQWPIVPSRVDDFEIEVFARED